MKVKICGITDVKTAFYAAQLGADALGFVFAESKRKVSIQQAAQIIQALPNHLMKVGVFVNERAEVIEHVTREAGLTAVQLHGDETPGDCKKFHVPVIKALSVGTQEDLERIHDYDCDYVLLDSPRGKYHGGNGVAFDWKLLKGFDFRGKKVILAGGLNPINVKEAILNVDPYMVDVSSGVETDGKKDLDKIKQFIQNAKGEYKEEQK